MRKVITILLFFIYLTSFSQNWNVFNKAYRYNYKFDNSALISNVLFADSVKQQGVDTVYYMNRIGVVNGTTLVINQPQFLNRTIIKLATGNIILQDPSTLTIIPSCTLNQTWLFNAANNFSATCVAINTISLFSTIDSVKTILVNNADSILLSKQFGLIQYPKLYAQNKYFRLAGIEGGAKYDSIPLFGIKVPNAWDFYNFNIGDKRCSYYSNYAKNGNNQIVSYCNKNTTTIKAKTITPTGYIYNVDVVNHNWNGNGSLSPCIWSTAPVVTTTMNTNNVYSGIDQKTLTLNSWYPNMVIPPEDGFYNSWRTLAKLGTDNANTFYKYYGTPNCGINPNTDGVGLHALTNGAYVLYGGATHREVSYATGIGLVNDNQFSFEAGSDYCLTCLIKNNVLVVGTGLTEINSKKESGSIYPNPAASIVNFKMDSRSQIKVYNSIGSLVKEMVLEPNSKLDVNSLPNGLYFVEIQSDSFKATQKLIIEH